jgi:hypothetical protein
MNRRFSVEEHEVHEKKDPYFKLFMENDAIGERTKQTYICCFRMIKEQLNKLIQHPTSNHPKTIIHHDIWSVSISSSLVYYIPPPPTNPTCSLIPESKLSGKKFP